jgi:hypothetical protein
MLNTSHAIYIDILVCSITLISVLIRNFKLPSKSILQDSLSTIYKHILISIIIHHYNVLLQARIARVGVTTNPSAMLIRVNLLVNDARCYQSPNCFLSSLVDRVFLKRFVFLRLRTINKLLNLIYSLSLEFKINFVFFH